MPEQELYCVGYTGYDYEYPHIIAVCSSQEEADKIAADNKPDVIWPWNQFGVFNPITINTLI